MSVYETALSYTEFAGLSVLPVRCDGSKSPAISEWKHLQSRKPTDDELETYFHNKHVGIGVITGNVSGGLEIIDIENVPTANAWLDAVKAAEGGPELLAKIVVSKSPRGYHISYRCANPSGSQNLALRPATEEELVENPKRKYYKLIETRGEGAYAIAPGSPLDVHETKLPYQFKIRDFFKLQVITDEERELLLDCARALNEYFPEAAKLHYQLDTKTGERPGDKFNDTASWDSILLKHGWKQSRTAGRWIRPGGKRDSAFEKKDGKLWVFSPAANLPFEKSVSKFEALAILEHGGDFAACARSLAGKEPKATVSAPAEEDEEYLVKDWPALKEAAYYGLAGEFVRLAAEESEADPAAILAAFLCRAGATFGSSSFKYIQSDKHTPKIFALVIGNSAKARKGTSLGPVKLIFNRAEQRLQDPLMVVSGLSSGEGLIAAVKQDVEEEKADKRLFVVETEFAGPLKAMQREGNTLSPVIRKAWDEEDLAILTRHNPISAKGAHISILGHITKYELAQLLQKVEKTNGLINRFCCFMVRRQRLVPFPRRIPDAQLEPLAGRLAEAIQFAQQPREMDFADKETRAMWEAVYPVLEKEDPEIGEETSRVSAQVQRIAMIYALLDKAEAFDVNHLAAALAVMDYCLASTRLVFTAAVESASQTAKLSLTGAILKLLESGEKAKKDITVAFKNTHKSKEIAEALASLQSQGKVEQRKERSKGPDKEIWRLRL